MFAALGVLGILYILPHSPMHILIPPRCEEAAKCGQDWTRKEILGEDLFPFFTSYENL